MRSTALYERSSSQLIAELRREHGEIRELLDDIALHVRRHGIHTERLRRHERVRSRLRRRHALQTFAQATQPMRTLRRIAGQEAGTPHAKAAIDSAA